LSRAADHVKAACITVLGSGHAPFATGTWGSLVATALFLGPWGLGAAGIVPRGAVEGLLVAGIVVSSGLSVAWGKWAIERYQRGDPKQFTLDEFAGQWVALLVAPLALGADAWSLLCVAGGQFLLFRVCDIVKPPPARQLERLPAGWGILLDDLFAGLYANIVGQLLWRLTPAAAWLGVDLNG
jgi:phosphatidylglycerophosphatase A